MLLKCGPFCYGVIQIARIAEVRGSVRTAPTDRPYMIKDLWPEMVPENQLPNSMSVWEASRFCVEQAIEQLAGAS